MFFRIDIYIYFDSKEGYYPFRGDFMFEENKDAEAAKNEFLRLLENVADTKKKSQNAWYLYGRGHLNTKITPTEKEKLTIEFLKGYLNGYKCMDGHLGIVSNYKDFHDRFGVVVTTFFRLIQEDLELSNQLNDYYKSNKLGHALGLYLALVRKFIVNMPVLTVNQEETRKLILNNSKDVAEKLKLQGISIKKGFIKARLIQIAKRRNLDKQTQVIIATMAAQFA